jgi:hypothetical protein
MIAMRQRYRRSWRGKLILQVEVVTNYFYPDGMLEYQITKWRDAKVSDLPYPGIGVV